MPVWKLAIWSILGFLLPVGFACFILPAFFQHSEFAASTSPLAAMTAAFGSLFGLSSEKDIDAPGRSDAIASADTATPEMQSEGFIELPAYSDTIPDTKDGFLASVRLTFDRLPNTGKRIRVLMKTGERLPYQGWALGFKRQPQGLRPEIFWQDRAAKGGWLPFNEMPLKEGVEYTFYVLNQEQKAISLFVELPNSAAADFGLALNGIPAVEIDGGRKILFAGGFDVTSIGSAWNERQLVAISPNTDKSGAIAKVSQVFMARSTNQYPSMLKAMQFLSGGSERFASELGQKNVAVWVREFPPARSMKLARSRPLLSPPPDSNRDS